MIVASGRIIIVIRPLVPRGINDHGNWRHSAQHRIIYRSTQLRKQARISRTPRSAIKAGIDDFSFWMTRDIAFCAVTDTCWGVGIATVKGINHLEQSDRVVRRKVTTNLYRMYLATLGNTRRTTGSGNNACDHGAVIEWADVRTRQSAIVLGELAIPRRTKIGVLAIDPRIQDNHRHIVANSATIPYTLTAR